ncbi:N-acetylglucosamine-6-phosphate deacetylase [Mesorhizobium sp. NBSH29]|uniref:N-acetylglucosamine-6-phosphate deacetylase n=1 Tax=Mesorhizobium sp. NBSH29 TaxID=2654249 RepID=UPI0018964169|nr:N-acetylglucosamine-6-phosphate deacetylase [Mesorhizobium sp. NBSH29]QPC86152.1 N-acetylglucosamine-6-phosphate deacetylase [Mesorhizobium sp. NBSH29]
MSALIAYCGARIFDGTTFHEGAALLVRGDTVEAIVQADAVPQEVGQVTLAGGLLVPGFVDLQVNGGGGVMLNDQQDVETIRTICAAHARFGTTALLPTLITDTPEITRAAVAAGVEAARQNVPGFLGLHLEGPHLSLARKGAHDPSLIRPMQAADEAMLVAARQSLPNLLTTIAPESVTPQQVAGLAGAGIIVSLGHSDAGAHAAFAYAKAGATVATHLFNAMSPIGNREPGLAGAAIACATLNAGIIADGIHVDAETMGIALRAKRHPGRIFLVTDAMATIGTDMTEFTLNGRTITRANGGLRLADGTLAGADLDMISAVRFVVETIGLPLDEALRMASLYPAQAMGVDALFGQLASGSRADIVHVGEGLDVRGVWIGGDAVFPAA